MIVHIQPPYRDTPLCGMSGLTAPNIRKAQERGEPCPRCTQNVTGFMSNTPTQKEVDAFKPRQRKTWR